MGPTENRSGALGARARLGQLRREAGSRSLATFCQVYLGAHFPLPGSIMHKNMLEALEEASGSRNARLAIAAPRGHAKSTLVSLAYVLWCIVYEKEPFIVLISNTADQAADLLTTVKFELEQNHLLLEDFPEVAESTAARPSRGRWRRTEIITRNQVRVLALGARQKIRGRKHGADRPSLIILDDIENDVDVQSADLRESTSDWFNKSVMKAGTTSHTNVVVVGTILHYDSLLSRLLGGPGTSEVIPGWRAMKYKAVLSFAERQDLWETWMSVYSHREPDGPGGPHAARDFFDAHTDDMLAGSEVLWPQREDYYQLMELRLREGAASFDSEKQNDPVDPKSCFFDPESIIYWDDQYSSVEALLADLGSKVRVFGACDPSLGREGKNRDNTAIVVIVEHTPTRALYVIDADIKKRKPLETIDTVLEYHRMRKFNRFAIETNQFQSFLASELIRTSIKRGVRLPVKEVNHTKDKLGRIQSLEPLISGGFLRFSRRHRQLLEEIRQFPKAAHDDGPDALQMAVEISRRPSIGFTFIETKDLFQI